MEGVQTDSGCVRMDSEISHTTVYQLPAPSGPLWEALRKHYSLPSVTLIEKTKITRLLLPHSWRVVPFRRNTKFVHILNGDNRMVGMAYVDDEYGETRFNKNILKINKIEI